MSGAGSQTTKPVGTNTGPVTASVLSESGVTPDNGTYAAPNNTNLINSNSWVNGQGIDLTEYYQVTITANAGQALNLLSFSLSDIVSSKGPRSAEIRTSVDNFGSTVGAAWAPTQTNANHVINFTGSQFTGLTTVTIRIYGYASTGTGAASQYALTQNLGAPTLTFDSFQSVPVPATALLVLVGVPVLLARRRFRRAAT
jgi:hypothetical protein